LRFLQNLKSNGWGLAAEGEAFGSDLVVGVGIGIGIECPDMSFGHERFDVWAALAYAGWAHHFCEGLKGHRKAKKPRREAIPIPIPTPVEL
jgi:hypothetical protein